MSFVPGELPRGGGEGETEVKKDISPGGRHSGSAIYLGDICYASYGTVFELQNKLIRYHGYRYNIVGV